MEMLESLQPDSAEQQEYITAILYQLVCTLLLNITPSSMRFHKLEHALEQESVILNFEKGSPTTRGRGRGERGRGRGRARAPQVMLLMNMRMSVGMVLVVSLGVEVEEETTVFVAVEGKITTMPPSWITNKSDELLENWKDSEFSMLPTYKELIVVGYKILVFGGDTVSVVPVTATRFSLSYLNLTVNTEWYPWCSDSDYDSKIERAIAKKSKQVRVAYSFLPIDTISSSTSYEVFGRSAACEDEFLGVGAVFAVVVDAIRV
ncbi:serine carboxypeptidase 24 [Tanacetum coccineum]